MAVSDNTKRQMYIVMLHLVQQKMSTFKELIELLDIETGNHLSVNILGGIARKIKKLEGKRGEKIPRINALVFTDEDEVTPWVKENVFNDIASEPTQKQIAELALSVATYDNWDKVLDEFKYWNETNSDI